MKVRERLQDQRPTWKVAVSLLISLGLTVICVGLALKAVSWFMPFVVGWILSVIAGPLVGFFEKRLKIRKKLGSVITIILVLAACIGLICLLVSKLWGEVAALIRNAPDIYRNLEEWLEGISGGDSQLSQYLPDQVEENWQTLLQSLDSRAGKVVGSLSEPTIEIAGEVAKKIPSAFIGTIVAFISAYFFIADKDQVNLWLKRVVPDSVGSRIQLVIDNLKFALGGYFKAQFKIMGVIFLILLAGFWIMGVHFSILLALAIAFLDFLPFFGTGTALIPWAVYCFFSGNYSMVVELLVLYGITQLVRQLIQPKLVGDSIGLNPLLTLFLLYAGYRLGSVMGMIFAVPVGVLVINLYKAGAFDYILDDVKVLAEDVMNLRRRGN